MKKDPNRAFSQMTYVLIVLSRGEGGWEPFLVQTELLDSKPLACLVSHIGLKIFHVEQSVYTNLITTPCHCGLYNTKHDKLLLSLT